MAAPLPLPITPEVSVSRNRGFGTLVVRSGQIAKINNNNIDNLKCTGMDGGTFPIKDKSTIQDNTLKGTANPSLEVYCGYMAVQGNRVDNPALISQRSPLNGTQASVGAFNNLVVADNTFGAMTLEGVHIEARDNDVVNTGGASTGVGLIDCSAYDPALDLRVIASGNMGVGDAALVDRTSLSVRVADVGQAAKLYGRAGLNTVGFPGTASTRPVNVVNAANADIPAAGTPNFFTDTTDYLVPGIPTQG